MVAGLLTGLLVACTSAPEEPAEEPAAPSTPSATAAPAPEDDAPPPSPAPPPTAAPPSVPPAAQCDADQRAQLVTTVDLQLQAIALGDWERAWGYASDEFRAGIDVDRFREIITDGFPVVAANQARDVGRCRTTATEATLEVVVEDDDGTQQVLLYLLRRAPEGWAIGGATPIGGDADAPRPPTVTA